MTIFCPAPLGYDGGIMTLATGKRVLLRAFAPADLDFLLQAHLTGEWREHDAPFERLDADEAALREKLRTWCEPSVEFPVRRAMVLAAAGASLGWVTRYEERRFPAAWMLGVGIARAADWGRGLGGEALSLWIDHLFENSTVHRLGLATWSLNPRMMALAQRLGFKSESVERELVEWRGEWLSRHGFGLLRSEWERRRQGPSLTVRDMAPGEAAACEAILHALPDWFGVPESIQGYRKDIESMETLVLGPEGSPRGFLTLKLHGEGAAEIQVMAVMSERQGAGMGRALIEEAEARLGRRGCELLQVKTLGPSRESEHYARTRAFYAAMGFIPLEEFTGIWEPGSHCLVLVKALTRRR